MVNTIKFSSFATLNNSLSTNKMVGISSDSGGTNVQVSFPAVWGTSTRPASPTLGTLGYNTNFSQYEYWNGSVWSQLAAGGSGTVNSGSINQIAWYAANGTAISGLATANNGVLITSSGGVPSISSTLPSAVQSNITSLGTITSGVWNGTSIDVSHGGTGTNTFTAYSVICAGTTATGALQNVSGLGTSGYVLTSNGPGALPSWQAGATVTPAALTEVNDTNVTLTLGGTPATSLLQAVSITAGWSGQLALGRGGTNNSLTANNGGIVWSDASKLNILSGTATANLPLLSGSTATPAWGAFALSLGGALTTAGALTTSGAFGATFTFTALTSVTFPTSGTLATTSQIPSGAALTKTDDTNVTLTLGGSPSTALVNAASITAGWTGTLSGTRGGTGVNNGSSTITIGGNVTFSGAFTFTGTITGNTAVTFPTSGTLATTSQIPSLPLSVSNGGTGLGTLTAHNILLGEGTSNVAFIAPSATSGVPVISQGASSDPVFGTAVVAGGGTGTTSLTAYAPLFGGTTSTGAVQSGTVGTINQVLMSGGASTLPAMQWPNQPNRYSVAKTFDFMLASTATTTDTTCTQSNTGTGAQCSSASQSLSTSGVVLGVSKFETGSTNAGASGVNLMANGNSANFPFYLGGGVITVEFCMYGVSALSNGTDRYTIYAGLSNVTAPGDTAPTRGVYFSYIDTANSGNWVGNCQDGGGTSSTNGSSGPAVNTAQTLKLIVNAAATSVSFYINDVLMSSAVTGNIPTATALMPAIAIIKSVGTNSISMYLDAARYQVDFTTPR